MRDSLDDLDMDLGRLPDSRTLDTPSPSAAQQIRRALRGKHVCPFCGTQRETDMGACMHCSLEDTPTTRTATRSKLGPWYVLQSRNPSAPGMNFATLMTLVQKGKVTARSVLRGPTTGQFWRHAAKVKGVSREFGLCWSCGGEIGKTARACPACKRLQEPPLNPDILLESAEFSSDDLAEAMWSDQTPVSSQMAAPPAPRVVAPPVERANGTAVDRLVARGGVRREVTHPYDAPAVGALPARPERGFTSDAGMEQLPASASASGPELAVFQMPPRPGEKRRRGSVVGRIVKTLFVALVLMALGVGVLCTFDEGIRHRCIGLARRGVDSVKTFFGAETPGRPLSDYKLDRTKEEDGGVEGAVSAPAAAKNNGTAASQASRTASAPQVTVGAPAGGQEALVRPTIEQKKMQVWDLWKAGKAAQDRREYGEALKAFELIKGFGLPEDDLPIGLDANIAAVKKQMK